MRFAICSGESPVYCQMMETTGMLMLGKMSVGVLRTASGPRIINRSARTAKVYGRRSARRTIHISFQLLLTTSGGNAANEVWVRVFRLRESRQRKMHAQLELTGATDKHTLTWCGIP